MCDFTFVTGTRNKLKFISLVRIPAVFVLVICGAEPEVSVSYAFKKVKLLAM